MSKPKINFVRKKGAKSNIKNVLMSLTATLLFGLGYYYFELPAINLHNTKFYSYFLVLSVFYCIVLMFVSKSFKVGADIREVWGNVKRICKVPLAICIILLGIFIAGGIFSSTLLRSKSYRDLLEIKTGDFSTGVNEITYDKIPMLDKASAQRLGDRKLGELSDMVSQFEVTNDYPQMNYKGSPVRVATLKYGDFFKWWNNFRNGLPAYIITDMVTQNVEVVRLKEGIKYSPSDLFFRNINRYIRFKYPTFMFDTLHMEIDEEGEPFWICPKLVKTIGLFGGTDIEGAVLVNAVTGETKYYRGDEIPKWVDRVYSADLIIEQYDYYGAFQNGYLNSIFGQKGVTETTAGYNYIAQDDDVYMYTGITSVGGDESNIGFILSNQRTKETVYYPCAGAEEFSAAASAEGVVQHLNYNSTFPLLLNISGEPTYFMSLKDNAGLVKMYAMVNVQQYNIVATGSTVSETEKEYIRLISEHGITELPVKTVDELSGVIEEIRTAVVDGTSMYYIKLVGRKEYYAISASDDQTVVILNIGDRVGIEFESDQEEGLIIPAKLK